MCDIITQKYNWSTHSRLWNSLCKETWLNAKKYPLQYHTTLNITNTQACSIIQLLLILSGSVEINPGPRARSFPCGECHKAVSIGPSSMWQLWSMVSKILHKHEWLCCGCGLRDVVRNSSISSVSSISQYPVCCKAKSLCILTANFQSLWNKKDEVEAFVLDNDIWANFYHMDTLHLEETIPTDGVEYYWLSRTNWSVSKSVFQKDQN